MERECREGVKSSSSFSGTGRVVGENIVGELMKGGNKSVVNGDKNEDKNEKNEGGDAVVSSAVVVENSTGKDSLKKDLLLEVLKPTC